MPFAVTLILAIFLGRQETCVQETTKEAGKEPERSASELSMEVAALQLLYDLQLTNEQLERIQKWAKDTAQKPRPRKDAEVSKEYRAKLAELGKALASAVDGELIENLVTEVDALRDKENPTLDDKVELTAAARKHAPELARLLKPKQVTGLLALDGESIDDPREKLCEALDGVRGLEGEEWKVSRDAIADEIARLAAGIDAKKYDRVHDDVIVLLVKVRKLDLDDFQKQHDDLKKEALTLIGDLGAVDFLRNYLEYNLAELLSNPGLSGALAKRLSDQPKEKEKKNDL